MSLRTLTLIAEHAKRANRHDEGARAVVAVLDVAENERMAQTSKEKQEAFRARQAMLGLKEVRGIYLPEALHPVIKEQAAKLLEQHAKEKE